MHYFLLFILMAFLYCKKDQTAEGIVYTAISEEWCTGCYHVITMVLVGYTAYS
jgi:hypothetical protein